jgi:Protein  of unknown function (DUF3018)
MSPLAEDQRGRLDQVQVSAGQGASASGAIARARLAPVQIRVPDVRSPAFRAEAHRQALAVAGSPHADQDQRFIDSVSEPDA